ncbi:arabinofuranosyltransferase [Amycolatopsis sp. NPDC102389]|uniref:arabinofuranosyltransferase n=1 Tax=Amycolatopsis sp. NPDC102389 TaxID=3363941 RepID=UPI0037F471AF
MALFAVIAWNRRWVCDDGLIVLRTVQNLLDGNGPVFNAGERVEANTSTLWTYLLVPAGFLGIRLEWAAVVLGLFFAVAGMALGLDGARRLHPSKPIVPAGALLLLGLSPFWDFATSGLETGLVTCWLAGMWWLLVRHATRPGTREWATVFVLGLGPLVRPEFALVTALGGVALLLIVKPGWKRALLWILVGGALPVGYQIFRMGYYGLITPNTALAKEASKARWDRGFYYIADLLDPYLLAIPLLTLVVVAALVLRGLTRATTIVVVLPVVAALALLFYVTRVGGDYMHGRMLLPSLLLLLLPVLAVPLSKWTALPVLVLGVWAVVSGGWLRAPSAIEHKIGAHAITDSRVFWLDTTGKAHPILADDAARATGYLPELAEAMEGKQGPVVAVSVYDRWLVVPARERTVVSSPGALGFPGMLLSSGYKVVDDLGLAAPLASHSISIEGGAMGHDKRLSVAWTIADAGRGTPEELSAATGGVVPAEEIASARRSLARPEIREMLASVRAPLTGSRFWDNLVHSVGRSALRYDRDPYVAQHGR